MIDALPARPWLHLPVETKVRELDGKLLMAAVAAEAGWHVALGDQNALVAQLPALPRGVYLDKAIAWLKLGPFRRFRALGQAVAAWCEEGLVYRDTQAYLHERIDPQVAALVDRFFAWGPIQARAVLSKAPELADRLSEVGNPRFDLLRAPLRDVFAPAATRIRHEHGRVLLINTNFSRYNHMQGPEHTMATLRARGAIDSPDREAFFTAWIAHLGRLFDAFAAMLPVLSAAFPNHTIVLRPHPSESFDRWRQAASGLGNVKVIHAGSAIPWLMAAEAMVHNSCTTGVEAFLLDRPVAAYRPVRDPVFDSELPHLLSREADTPDGLVDLVRDLLDRGPDPAPRRRTWAADYIAALDGALAADRVMVDLAGLAQAPAPVPATIRRLPRMLTARHLPAAKRLVRRGLRAVRPGGLRNSDFHAYAAQKFPGLSLLEVNAQLATLGAAAGRFEDLTALPLGHRLFLVTRQDDTA